MFARFLALTLVLAAAATLAQHSAGAAIATGAVITGGELGEYAAYIEAPFPAEGPFSPEGVPLDASKHEVAPPKSTSGPAYDVYWAPGSHGISNRPVQRYYADLGLMQRLNDNGSEEWYAVDEQTAAFMQASIADALAKKDRGELEQDVIAAALRGRSMDTMIYWLRPYHAGDEMSYLGPAPYTCECLRIAHSEPFIMEDLTATLRRDPQAAGEAQPTFLIEFQGHVDGGGGVGGLLGFYLPPEGDTPGRFWTEGYLNGETDYYVASEGFDAVMAQALADEEPAAPPADDAAAPVVESDDDGGLPVTLIAIAAMAVLVGLGGGIAIYGWRRWT